MQEIKYIMKVSVGSINPNAPFSEQAREDQLDLLNRCLSEFPKGKIIGRDVTIGMYKIGEHQLTTEKVTYHVGFERKPFWLDEKAK
jgi:hypothetical protein